MSHYTCRVCGGNALDGTGGDGRRDVIVVHAACHEKFKRDIAAEALELAADGTTRRGITGLALRKFRAGLRNHAAILRAKSGAQS